MGSPEATVRVTPTAASAQVHTQRVETDSFYAGPRCSAGRGKAPPASHFGGPLPPRVGTTKETRNGPGGGPGGTLPFPQASGRTSPSAPPSSPGQGLPTPVPGSPALFGETL